MINVRSMKGRHKYTQRQAWRVIALAFEAHSRVESTKEQALITFSGLCNAVDSMYYWEWVSLRQWNEMCNTLQSHRPPDRGSNSYWWPLDYVGASDRARFVRTKILKQKAKK